MSCDGREETREIFTHRPKRQSHIWSTFEWRQNKLRSSESLQCMRVTNLTEGSDLGGGWQLGVELNRLGGRGGGCGGRGRSRCGVGVGVVGRRGRIHHIAGADWRALVGAGVVGRSRSRSRRRSREGGTGVCRYWRGCGGVGSGGRGWGWGGGLGRVRRVRSGGGGRRGSWGRCGGGGGSRTCCGGACRRGRRGRVGSRRGSGWCSSLARIAGRSGWRVRGRHCWLLRPRHLRAGVRCWLRENQCRVKTGARMRKASVDWQSCGKSQTTRNINKLVNRGTWFGLQFCFSHNRWCSDCFKSFAWAGEVLRTIILTGWTIWSRRLASITVVITWTKRRKRDEKLERRRAKLVEEVRKHEVGWRQENKHFRTIHDAKQDT